MAFASMESYLPLNITVAYTRIGTEPEYSDVERVFVTIPHVLRGRAS